MFENVRFLPLLGINMFGNLDEQFELTVKFAKKRSEKGRKKTRN